MSFLSILDTTSGTVTMESALLCMAAALILGFGIAFVYMRTSDRCSKNFVITLALLPILVEVVILLASGSLGTAVAVAGTFSLVRFRSVPGTSREIMAVFFAMAVGLACGMGELVFAVLFTVIVAGVMWAFGKMRFGERSALDKTLKVSIPEDLDYTSIFDDIFAKYTVKADLMKVKTVNLGSMFELDYDIVLKDASLEKQMIDDIRVRNGNLTVVSARHADSLQEL